MKRYLVILTFLILFPIPVWAETIPLMIPVSGSVAVDGKPFNGEGKFKFSIIHKECTLSPLGKNCASFWHNDNLNPTLQQALVEPDNGVTLPVSNGAFFIKLGDTALINMKGVPSAVFSNAETYLRIWFDGGKGFQLLIPDRQLVSVPYAYRAETANTVTGTGAVSGGVGGIIKDGTITTDDLAFNPATQESLNAHKGSADHDSRYVTKTELAAAAPASGQATSATPLSTTSTAWVDMPSMSVTLTTSGGNLLMSFTTQVAHSAQNGLVGFRFMVDGQPVTSAAFGNAMIQSTLAVAYYQQNVSATWLATGIASGQHTVKVQWKIAVGGTAVAPEFASEESDRTLVVVEIK